MAGWNHLDYAIVVIIAMGSLYGLGRGALRMATSILSLVAGIAVASAWHARVGAIIQEHFSTTPAVSSVLGYFALFGAVAVIIELAGRRIIALAQIVNLSWIDRLGGALFGASLAALFAGVDVLILTAMLSPDSNLLHDSQLVPKVAAFDQALLAYVPPDVKQAYEQRRDEILRYWQSHKENPAGGDQSAPSGT